MRELKYDFARIEPKWQKKWLEEKTYAAVTGDTEYKLAQTIAAFLGRHMES